MSIPAVSGLQTALKSYASEKVKERSEGHSRIRQLFSNPDNLRLFQETASRDGGAGWIALFQCLFLVVSLEKKVYLKKGSGPQAERRLSEAVSLVRWMAEKSVKLISRKPFQYLFTHMTSIMVIDGILFPLAALDYAKALRALLSYPPHLASLDEEKWKAIMGICWVGLLGEGAMDDMDWGDTSRRTTDNGGFDEGEDLKSRLNGGETAKVSSVTVELASLLPILSASSSAPLLPLLPTPGSSEKIGHCIGYGFLHDIHRFLRRRHSNDSVELNVFRSLNIILAELELNCRDDFVEVGKRLLPQLVAYWTKSSKALREQLAIALRMLLPFLTLRSVLEADSDHVVLSALESLLDFASRESVSRWGISPLDIEHLRLRLPISPVGSLRHSTPFEKTIMTAGHGFTEEDALGWAAIELYAEACFCLKDSSMTVVSSTPVRDAKRSKKRKVNDCIASMISGCGTGNPRSRLLHLQIVVFLVDRHWTELMRDDQGAIRQVFGELLDDEDALIQQWNLLAWALAAGLPPVPAEDELNVTQAIVTPHAGSDTADVLLDKVWSHAMRKITVPTLSRPAALAAACLLKMSKAGSSAHHRDIASILQTIDVQGPPGPSDAIGEFLCKALDLVQHDVQLYDSRLEDKVLAWYLRWSEDDAARSRWALEQWSSATIVQLLISICGIATVPIVGIQTADLLPECPLVDRLLKEEQTDPIRQFILNGSTPNLSASSAQNAIPKLENPPIPSNTQESSLASQHDRPRQISNCLTGYLSVSLIHPSSGSKSNGHSGSPLVAPERLRRMLDMAVAALLFQGAIELSGQKPNKQCLQSAMTLIDSVEGQLKSTEYDYPSRLLIWSAFRPLIGYLDAFDSTWPAMLKPGEESGIRQDLLANVDGGQGIAVGHTEDPAAFSLQHVIWKTSSTNEALRSIVSTCLELSSDSESKEVTSRGDRSSELIQEEDDFGEVRNAESDAMPRSKEAVECTRTKVLLYDLICLLRVRGTIFLTPGRTATRDSSLINAVLSAEPRRLLVLGASVIRVVKQGALQLSAEAIDLLLGSFEEMIRSYAFSRDEGLLELVLDFLAASASLWAAEGFSAYEMAERAIHLAKFLVAKSTKGQLTSWRVRLALLHFIDEYLDYDPEMSTWKRYTNDDYDMDEGNHGPEDVITGSLVDKDMRVRFRAATSAAGLLYLTCMSEDQHTPFYHSTVSSLPRNPHHWDSFLTDILWKMNCCIASAQLRAATIYHLYEVPASTDTFNLHLQAGLESIARRLGLDGIAPLYLAHGSLIVSSQISAGQSPLRVPSKLYGFPSRRTFALAVLGKTSDEIITAAVAEQRGGLNAAQHAGSTELYSSLCDSAGMDRKEMTEIHLPTVIARVLCNGQIHQGGEGGRAALNLALSSLGKGCDFIDTSLVSRTVQNRPEEIIGSLLSLLDLSSTAEIHSILQAKSSSKSSKAEAFSSMFPNDFPIDSLSSALPPSTGISMVVEAIVFLQSTAASLSTSRAVFGSLIRLFNLVNESFLISEQCRYLRAIAVVLALYTSDLRNPTILTLFLREVIALLCLPEVHKITFCMLRFGLMQAAVFPKPLNDLPSLFASIGKAFSALKQGTPHQQSGAPGVIQLVQAELPTWQKSASFSGALAYARACWPEALRLVFSDHPNPTHNAISLRSSFPESANAVVLCRQMAVDVEDGHTISTTYLAEFQQETFWRIKESLGHSMPGPDEIHSFLDLLYKTDGQVHAPALQHQPDISVSKGISKSSKDESATQLRSLVVEKVAKLTTHTDHAHRLTAFDNLRGLLPHITDLLQENALSQKTKDTCRLLTPITRKIGNASEQKLHVLLDDQSWVRRARLQEQWAVSFATLLCSNVTSHRGFFAPLPTLFREMPFTASDFLPLLVHAVLLPTTASSGKSKDTTHTQSAQILSAYFTQILHSPKIPSQILERIVAIMLHLRHFQPPHQTDDLAFESWLDVDPMLLSQAALRCNEFVTALMFLELDRSKRVGQEPLDLYDPDIQHVMYEAYSNVDDPDGFYGIKTHDVANALHRRLIHEGEFWRSFGLHSAGVEVSAKGNRHDISTLGTMQDLHRLGFNRVASLVHGTSRGKNDLAPSKASEALTFDLAWRTGDWDLPLSQTPNASARALLYSCLRAIHRERNLNVAQGIVTSAIRTELTRLGQLGSERMTSIRQTVQDLLCLREIEQWLTNDLQGNNVAQTRLPSFSPFGPSFPFASAENLIAVRRSLLSAAQDRESKHLFGDLSTPQMETLLRSESHCLLDLSRLARKDGNLQASINAMVAILSQKASGGMSDLAEDEFGHVLWAQQEHALAIQHVEERMGNISAAGGPSSGKQLAVLLGRIAKWSSMAKYRSPEEIKLSFEDARRLSAAHKISSSEQSELCHDYAIFADKHQSAMGDSPELERLLTYADRNVADSRAVFPSTASSRRTAKSTVKTNAQELVEQERREDEEALQEMLSTRAQFVGLALRMYATSLALSDSYDDSTTRMISLWLEHDTDDGVNSAFAESLDRVPSHKFVFMAPQLAARLDRPRSPTAFNLALNGLMLRLGRQHPFHTLYQVLTLAEGFTAPSKSRRISDGGAEGRAPAAASILATLHASTKQTLAQTAAKEMKALTDGAIQWCLSKSETEEKSSVGQLLDLPSDFPLRNLSHLHIPVPTAPPPLDPTGKYENFAPMSRFSSKYALLAGLHRPKRMQVYDSASAFHRLLFKGDDEVRQDAVMEQVFDMSNKLLLRDRKTKERNLRFRTYVVIPLARKSGIIECVGDSIGIGEWLKPAHHRYGRITKDIPVEDFRTQLKPIQEHEKKWNQLPPKFHQMMQRFHPVMRHFFTERHRDPLAWFTMRLNYIQSAAVTSMVGWMLGVGDRHCSNIMIDQVSGELVHIDFGIVFEDGQRLRIPEKVPFRLTNDIVDGFGITGVDGTFRRCSEHTLRVLRESSDLILTVLEVFKHDPLYAWDADPDKLQRAQGGGRVAHSSASALERADRILSKIRQKLRDDLSVEYRVNELIQEARNEEHLAKIFIGWQPWY